MPFYVSPQQAMQDKANYAQQGVARGRSCVALQYAGGILMVSPNASNALHKISELYDSIGFAAVGRYNEYENLRKAGITYADIMGYQYDRNDVTARGIANYYAQQLGTIFTESPKPWEVELVVAEIGEEPSLDQIYRITFDGSVSDESGYVAFGGDAGKVSAVLKERYSEGMTLAEAFGAAIAALSALAAPGAPAAGNAASAAAAGNGADRPELTAGQLEVAILDRARDHRKFRRIRGARLEELLVEARAVDARATEAQDSESGTGDGEPAPGESGTSEPGTSEPGTGEPGTGEPGTGEPGTGEGLQD
jgi:proteasome alpha subunit